MKQYAYLNLIKSMERDRNCLFIKGKQERKIGISYNVKSEKFK